MARYRAKPENVSAWQYEGDESRENAPAWVDDACRRKHIIVQPTVLILQPSGIPVRPGMWIVEKEGGTILTYSDSYFRAHFEAL